MSVEFVEKKRWLFLGLPFTFTKYVIKEDMITVDTGVFTKVENDCYMYKVQDVEHTASIWERMVGLGTIVCYTGDTTQPKLLIEHIRNSKAIKEFILKESEEARLKRRTVNMLDIGSGEVGDIAIYSNIEKQVYMCKVYMCIRDGAFRCPVFSGEEIYGT